MARQYNVPTSDADTVTVDPAVVRETLIEIAAGNGPVTMECFSLQCEGETTFVATPETQGCPNCGSTADAYRIGTYNAESADDGLDATQYGEPAHDAVAPAKPTPKRKNANNAEGVREGFDVDQARAKVCSRNNWDWEKCKAIFNVGGEILTATYFAELKTL